jgi:hypothetical protein
MTKPKKKPKTGDVVGWVVLDNEGDIRGGVRSSREDSRSAKEWMNDRASCPPYRIAKIVLAK